jgi:DNA helicase II / ATP-dependent DNA helicase PcrA
MLTEIQSKQFCAARRKAIATEFRTLNPQQREGVLTTEGPLLLLAGAGSGKTTVLINRIANLMKYGCGSDSDEVPEYVTEDDLSFLEQYAENPTAENSQRAENLCRLHPVAPWNIIAITFTNRAAAEIKERLEKRLGTAALDIWASTFHSACSRILRRDIDKLGFSNNFTIYDTDDSLRVIKEILRAKELDEKMYAPRSVLNAISKAKDNMQLSGDFAKQCQREGDFRLIRISEIYAEYERRLWEADALDFDDIILHTVRLLQSNDEVRAYWQQKFRYVLIDEYQDTNHMQYLLAALLAGRWENICVVGDDDQSIYRFRGATIENILNFEEQYRGTRVIRLEQNYRSTENILDAANSVIRNNTGRKGKNLWTAQKGGELIAAYTAMNENDEAQYVASKIIAAVSKGAEWSDFAVLYRMNALSNQMEYAFKRNGIPYTVYGGTKFFDRAEVKDMLAYLCVVHNPADDLRLKRIINTPARGIGAKAIEALEQVAQQEGLPLYEVALHARVYPQLERQAAKLAAFTDLIESLRTQAMTLSLEEFYDKVIETTGYITALEQKNTVENRTRIENVRELKSSIQGYLANAETPTLAGFLDEVSLYTDLDSRDPNEPCVTMMTIHAAKGLEFKNVFLVGMEETIFPGSRAIGEQDEMEEERRLCYVAITRAKETLTLTCAAQRMLFGRTTANRMSRFIEEIPSEYVHKSGKGVFSDREREYGGGWRDSSSGNGSYGGYSGGKSSYASSGRMKNSGGISIGRSAPVAKKSGAGAIPLQKGNLITHDAFGQGMVISVTPMGGDALLEVAFDGVGTKRLMYKSASAHIHKVE